MTWISFENWMSLFFITITGMEREFWVKVMMYKLGVCWMFVIMPWVLIVLSIKEGLIWDMRTDFGGMDWERKSKAAMPRMAIVRQSLKRVDSCIMGRRALSF